MDDNWTREERGWHTHPRLGSIVLERDGQWWLRRTPTSITEVYKTLQEAKVAAGCHDFRE